MTNWSVTGCPFGSSGCTTRILGFPCSPPTPVAVGQANVETMSVALPPLHSASVQIRGKLAPIANDANANSVEDGVGVGFGQGCAPPVAAGAAQWMRTRMRRVQQSIDVSN